jgi:exopolyphosphatase/guanosine-5'-triphosphate,3'-diphosphate pyrophosphatase
MRFASIDIGTNTTLMLIAEIKNFDIVTLHEELRIPRLGKDLSTSKIIANDSTNQLIQILNEYKSIANEFRVEKIICGGTAVFRKASNSRGVIETLEKETGLSIKILSPEQEAILTFLGGISNFPEFFSGDITVIDIGGGSTEIVWGNLDEIKFFKSYEIGAVTLKDLFFHSYPYRIKIDLVHESLEKFFVDDFSFHNSIAIAVAGTPTTLASIYHNQKVFDEKQVDKTYFNLTFLNNLISKFYLLSPEQILTNFPSVIKGREDVILPGTIILKHLIEKLGIDGFYVSARGIRYGLIIYEIINYGEGFWRNVGLRKFLSSFFGKSML